MKETVLARVPNLSVRQLLAIVAVAKYASFIAAASEMKLSQPGLSRMIRSAEDALGSALFERTTRQVALTSAGAEFVPLAERMLHDLELGSDSLRELREQSRGHLSLSCPMAFATNMLAPLIIRYKRERPNVVVNVHEGIQSNSIALVRSGQVDFGIGAPSDPQEDLHIEELCPTHYHAVFHKSHRFAKLDRLELNDLRGEPVVSMPPSSNMRRILDGAAANAGFRLDYTITLNTYSALAQFVRRKVGITILVSTSLPNDPMLRSLPIEPEKFKGQLALMRLKSRPMSAAATAFEGLVRAHFSKWRKDTPLPGVLRQSARRRASEVRPTIAAR